MMHPSFSRLTRRAGVVCAALGLAFVAASARAEVVEEDLLNPNDATDIWGKKITGLGANGDETALVFTKTGETLNWTLPDGVKSIWYLVVGGGGSGGAEYGNYYAGGGGGGAGGMLEKKSCQISSQNLTISVGAGGAAVSGATNGIDGKSGDNSVLVVDGNAVTAHGGGGGGAQRYSSTKGAGLKGGSGGGGGRTDNGLGGGCYEGEGHVGGSGTGYANHTRGGGGGGGAGGDGVSTTASKGGDGGSGAISSIGGGYVSKYKDDDGNEYYCAGGGGGFASTTATQNPGAGGLGGGGKGGGDTGVNASNYGCGGGGTKGSGSTTTRKSGAGYQGVIIVRYRVMAANEVPVPTIAAKDYNGSLQTADIADGPGYYVSANVGGTDAGDYVVTLTLSNSFVWVGGSTDPTNLTFTITKIANSWVTEPTLSKTAWELDEEAATVNPGAAASETSVVVTYDEAASEMPLTVGGHSAIFTVAESQNYLALSKTIGYTINKNTNVWTTEPSLSKTTWAFDESAATVTVGAAKYGEVVVTYDDDSSLTELPTALGEHAVKFAVAATDTYTALEKTIDYEVTKKVNSWTTQPVVSSFNIEDPAPVFTPPTAKFGEVVTYYDGDPEKTEMPTDLGLHSVTYKVLEGGDYTAFEQTIVYAVTYKPIVDQNDPSKVLGYRLPKLGAEQNEVALVFTNTAYSFDSPMSYSLPTYVTSVSYLVVGGGAAGGSANNANGAGGGGAGGVATNASPLEVAGGASFTLVVGAGGASVLGANGENGRSSALMFNDGPSFLGGKGGGGSKGGNGVGGDSFACGGGAGGTAGATGYDYAGGTGTISKGGAAPRGFYNIGGGGGGAGADGAYAASGTTEGSRGGMGVPVTIFGEELWIAGGGSGSRKGDNSYPSIGGGGKGGDNANPATDGSTWGAGGGGATVAGGCSGAGHQGVVVIRYVEDATAVAVPVINAKAYNGELQTAEVPSSSYYTVTANEGGTDVGEYPVELTLATGYHWDGGTAEPTNLVFAITQGQNEWTVEPSISKDNWLTTDEPGVLTNGVTRFGEVTRVLVKNGALVQEWTGDLPTAAGVYVITNIAPATTANYLAPEVTEKTVSFTIFGASETPDFTVSFNGDVSVGANEGVVTAAVPYRVSCDVESPKLVNIHALVTLDGAAATDVMLAENVALDATGIGLLNDLKPGATYEVALYGLGVEDGKSSPTTDVVHVTTPGPATGLSASATFTNDPKEFVISGSVTPGLGTTTVYLRWSLNSDALDNLKTYTFVAGDAGAFAANIAYTALSDTLTWDVAVSNDFASTTYGALSWNDALAATTKTRVDMVATTYTWTGNGGDNLWTNDANWTANRAESYGYPDNSSYATAKFTMAATVDLDGGTFELVESGVVVSSNLGEVRLCNGAIDVPYKDFAYGASGTTIVFDSVTIKGQKGLKFVGNSPTVFSGDTVQEWHYEPWDTKNTKMIVRNGQMSSGFFQTYIDDSARRHVVDITNAVWTVRSKTGQTKYLSSPAIVMTLLDGADRQAQFVSLVEMSLGKTWSIAIPEQGHQLPSIQAPTLHADTDSCQFEVNVTDYKSGRKVPLVKFTGADQSETMVSKLEKTTLAAKTRKKNGDLVDVTAKRNAQLVWSAEDNTLYYKQDAQLGMMVFVR